MHKLRALGERRVKSHSGGAGKTYKRTKPKGLKEYLKILLKMEVGGQALGPRTSSSSRPTLTTTSARSQTPRPPTQASNDGITLNR